MLERVAHGFGSLAFANLLRSDPQGEPASVKELAHPLLPKPSHYPPRAKQVIMLYMDGGPAQMDTFDPKPRLSRDHGKPFAMKMEPTQFNNNGNTYGSPWSFREYGREQHARGELFPPIRLCR